MNLTYVFLLLLAIGFVTVLIKRRTKAIYIFVLAFSALCGLYFSWIGSLFGFSGWYIAGTLGSAVATFVIALSLLISARLNTYPVKILLALTTISMLGFVGFGLMQ